MNFVGVGVPELILIAVLALIFVGPQRLPEVMGQIGRTVRDLRRQASEVTRQFTDEFDDIRDDYRDVRGDLTGMRDEMRDETASLNRELKSTVSEAGKAASGPTKATKTIETSARIVEDPLVVVADGDEPAPEPQKVVRMQRRSSKRKLPAADSKPTNTNT